MNIQRQKWKTNFTEYFVDQIEHRTPFNRLRFPVRGTRHPRARRDVEGCSSIVRRRQRGTMARKAQRGGSTMETAEGGLARNRPQSGLSSRYRFWPRRCQLELDQLVFFLFFFFFFTFTWIIIIPTIIIHIWLIAIARATTMISTCLTFSLESYLSDETPQDHRHRRCRAKWRVIRALFLLYC